MSEPRTVAGKRLLRYAQGLPPIFLTQNWHDGILAIEAEDRSEGLDALRAEPVAAIEAFLEADLQTQREVLALRPDLAKRLRLVVDRALSQHKEPDR